MTWRHTMIPPAPESVPSLSQTIGPDRWCEYDDEVEARGVDTEVPTDPCPPPVQIDTMRCAPNPVSERCSECGAPVTRRAG